MIFKDRRKWRTHLFLFFFFFNIYFTQWLKFPTDERTSSLWLSYQAFTFTYCKGFWVTVTLRTMPVDVLKSRLSCANHKRENRLFDWPYTLVLHIMKPTSYPIPKVKLNLHTISVYVARNEEFCDCARSCSLLAL